MSMLMGRYALGFKGDMVLYLVLFRAMPRLASLVTQHEASSLRVALPEHRVPIKANVRLCYVATRLVVLVVRSFSIA
jgi:hypothetical protein